MLIGVLPREIPSNRKLIDVMRETIRLKHYRPIVDDNSNSEIILWEDRQ